MGSVQDGKQEPHALLVPPSQEWKVDERVGTEGPKGEGEAARRKRRGGAADSQPASSLWAASLRLSCPAGRVRGLLQSQAFGAARAGLGGTGERAWTVSSLWTQLFTSCETCLMSAAGLELHFLSQKAGMMTILGLL